MTRYYFHTRNGENLRDDEGVDLPGPSEARAQALEVLGEILRYRGPAFWETGRFSVVVTDADNAEIVTLTAFAHLPRQSATS